MEPTPSPTPSPRVRATRGGVGLLLVLAGSLLVAASWQRWAGVCGWAGGDSSEPGACLARQDHRYDVLAPSSPWEPLGNAASLAGASLLVGALALALLPWAVTGRRPGRVARVFLAGAVLAQVAVGVATLAAGTSDDVVRPVGVALAVYLWLLWPPGLFVRLAVGARGPSRGWARATCLLLLLGSPLVAALTYANGEYDARPWWEAVAGLVTAAAGLCLLVAAPARRRSTTLSQPTSASSGSGAP